MPLYDVDTLVDGLDCEKLYVTKAGVTSNTRVGFRSPAKHPLVLILVRKSGPYAIE